MATTTLGTNATDSLTSLVFASGTSLPADVATIAQAIKDDKNPSLPIYPGAFSQSGQLFIPNRGVLRVLPGDYIAVDTTTGWPILVSALAIASGPFTHS